MAAFLCFSVYCFGDIDINILLHTELGGYCSLSIHVKCFEQISIRHITSQLYAYEHTHTPARTHTHAHIHGHTVQYSGWLF